MDNCGKNDKTAKKSKKKPGYIFDERMLLHKSNNPGDPEKPERAVSIHMNLIKEDLLTRLESIRTDYISDEMLLLVHTSNHIDNVNNLSIDNQSNEKREENTHGYNLCYDTFDNAFTSGSARLASNSVLKAIDKVVKKKINGAFLVVRPPGHHAYPELASGFCFYNNVAIGAKYAIKKHKLKRVAIVDWDVHHGNGTQQIFYESNEVLFISFHRFDKGLFYPFVKGNYTEIGTGEGKGYNINIPLNAKCFGGESVIGDEEYIYAFHTIVMPILNEFNPELILVSCGFDAAKGDPLGRCSVTPFGYGYMVNCLKQIVGNQIVIVLEGGYNLNSLAVSSIAVVKALLGDSIVKEINGEIISFEEFKKSMRPAYYVLRDINEYRSFFSQFWKSLNEFQPMFCKTQSFYLIDDYNSKIQICDLFGKNISRYFFNDYKDIESLLEGSDFIKIKIGKVTFLDKTNKKKYLKHLIISERSGSNERGFRIEGVNVTRFSMHWSKYDSNLDFNKEDKIIQIIKLCFNDKLQCLIDLLTVLIDNLTKLTEFGIDLINLDLFLIKEKNDNIHLKLNNLKNYSIIRESDKKGIQNEIFSKGLSGLYEFLCRYIKLSV